MKTIKAFSFNPSSEIVSNEGSYGENATDLLKLEMWPLKDACEYVLYEGRRSKWDGDRTSKSYPEAVASIQAGALTGTLNPALNDYLVRPKDFLSWAELKGKTIWEVFAELANSLELPEALKRKPKIQAPIERKYDPVAYDAVKHKNWWKTRDAATRSHRGMSISTVSTAGKKGDFIVAVAGNRTKAIDPATFREWVKNRK